MTHQGVGGLEDVLQILRLLPACVVREAASGNEDLENFLWFPTNIASFAERLVSIAGLAATAIYVDHLLIASDGAQGDRDQLIDNYLTTVLFSRGYGHGLACSIIQRCGVLASGPLCEVVAEDHPIPELVTSRPEDPGNLVRSQLHDPPEAQLAALGKSVCFLRDFSFSTENGMPCVRFRQKEIEVRPFLIWDGRDLWRFKRIMREEGEGDQVLCLSTGEGEERLEPLRIDSRVQRRIVEVGKALGLEKLISQGESDEEVMPQSVMPLFAESYPVMNRLAQKIYEETTESTRFKLWVSPLFGDDYEKVRELLSNEVFITNAIIKQCMDNDPVSVMESYFFEEPGDPAEYFTFLVRDHAERRRIDHQIKSGVDEYRSSLSPFYCQAEQKEDLDRLVSRYRARLVAQKIVRLFGFPIIENGAQEGLEDYIRRAEKLKDYLAMLGDDADAAKVRDGLMACSRAAEAILRLILLFYNSLRWYRADHPESLDEVGTSHLEDFRGQLKKGMFGNLIRMVKELGKDEEIKEKLRVYLGRERLWPEGSIQKAFRGLTNLQKWRNEQAHERQAPINMAHEIVDGFIDFLDWLADPLRQPGQSWRIFPALLSLNVVTRNSCGISSIKYTLMSHRSPRPITLYTQQPLSANSGSFFGLPHLNKTIKDLWVNPVLIPSRLLLPSRAVEMAT